MAWTAGLDHPTGYLISSAIWNSYLGTSGGLNWLKIKSLWVPVTVAGGPSGAMTGNLGYPHAQLSADTDDAFMSFLVPDDFLTLLEAKIYVFPAATQAAANWDIGAIYCGTGQAYNTHVASDVATTYNVTDGQLFEVDISSLLSSLAIGDIVGVTLLLSNSLHDVKVLGLYIKYQ